MSNAGRYLGPNIRTGANSYRLAPIHINVPRLERLTHVGRVSEGINDEYRRGTSLGSGKLSPITPFIWEDFVGEHRHKKSLIDAAYAPIFKGLQERTINEIEKHKEFAKTGQALSALNAAQKDLETTVKSLEEKEIEFESKATEAYSLYGLYPLYLMVDLPFRKIYDGVHKGADGFFQSLIEIDVAYKAALEQKRISLERNILANQLPELAQKINQQENASPNDPGRVASWASNKLSVLNIEKNVRLGLLAYFHQEAIVKAAGNLDSLTRAQALERYVVAIDHTISTEKSAIGPYQQVNNNIKSPLSKPELEALYALIELQKNKSTGPRWLDYHTSLLHSESVRQLTEMSNAFKGMVARAKEAEAKQAADQQKQDYLDGLSFVADANEKALQKYGANLSGIAKALQSNVSGKNIRSYTQAMATFEKVTLNQKTWLSHPDRQAVVNALNAFGKETFADNVTRLGKAFGVVGKIVQADKIYNHTVHGFLTGDFKPLMLELEAMALGIGVGAVLAVVTAFFFPVFVTTTMGAVVVSVMMASAAAYIDAEKVDQINNLL